MSEHSDPAGRRQFLKLVGGTVALVPLAGLTACGGGNDSAPATGSAPSAGSSGTGGQTAAEKPAAAEKAPMQAETAPAPAETGSGAAASSDSLPKLALDDPQAKSLGYVHDATTVDQSKYTRYQPGQACSNCALFQAQGSDEWARCSIFPGKLVNKAGWCSAYAPKG